MANLKRVNSELDALGMTNIRVAKILKGEHKGKFAVIQIVSSGQPKQLYMSNKMNSCVDFIKGKYNLENKAKKQDIKSTRMMNNWLKQNGLGKIIKVSSELKGTKRVYTIYSLDPRYKNQEIYKGSLKQCVAFIKNQTGIQDKVQDVKINNNTLKIDKVQNSKKNMIRTVEDANTWLVVIGASNRFDFYIDPRSKERGGTIYKVDDHTNVNGGGWSRSLYLMVQMVAKQLKEPMPSCIDDRGEKVTDVASANRWLDRIGYGRDYRFGTAKGRFGGTQYALAYKSGGKQKIEGVYKSLNEAITLMCDNIGEPSPYMDWMDK